MDMKNDKDRLQGESEGAGINIWRKAKWSHQDVSSCYTHACNDEAALP